MPTFSTHSTQQRLFAGSMGAVYTVQDAASGTLRAARHFEPPALWDEEKIAQEIELFLSRARTQQAASKTSQYIAPIHDFGPLEEGGAYYITDLYQRSAQKLIEGRVHLAPEDLRTFMLAVTRGLQDFAAATGRPHGNLRPSNVLITVPELDKAHIVLSDPAPEQALKAKADREIDVHALGELLFQIVVQRPYTGGGAAVGPEWKALGKSGAAWLELCNLLLNPAAAPEERSYDALIQRMESIRIPKKKNPVPLIAATIVLLLVVGVGGYFYATRDTRDLTFRPDDWRALCINYGSWFESFRSAALRNRAALTAPGYPQNILTVLDAAKKVELDPRKIVGSSDYVDRIIDPPPLAAGKHVAQTLDALTVMAKIKYILSADGPPPEILTRDKEEIPTRWPVLQQLTNSAHDFDQKGWRRLAAYLQHTADSVAPQPPPFAQGMTLTPDRTLLDRMQQAVSADQQAQPLVAAYDAVQQQAKALAESTGNPILAKFGPYATGLLASDGPPATAADFQSAVEQMKAAAALASQLRAVADDKTQPVDWQLLNRDAPVRASVQASDPPTAQQFQAVLEASKQYIKVASAADPRTAGAVWDDQLKEQASMLTELHESIPADAAADRQAVATLSSQRADLLTNITALRAIPAIRKNLPELKTKVAAVDTELAALRQQVGRLSDTYLNYDDWWAGIRTAAIAQPFHDPLLDQPWQAYHLDLTRTIKIDQLKQQKDRYKTRQKIVGEEKILTARLAALARLFPPPQFAAAPDRAWQADLSKRLSDLRHAALTSAVALLPGPAAPGDITQLAAALATQYQSDQQQITALAKDYALMQDRLARFELAPSDAQGPTLAELYAPWQKTAYLKDPAIARALAPLTDRAQRVLTIAQADSAAAVLKALAEPGASPEADLAAWRRLMSPQLAWTVDTPTLSDLQTIAAAVDRALTADQQLPPARRSSLQKAMAESLPAAWQKHTATARTRPQLDAAFAAVPAFQVKPAAFSIEQRYDWSLYQLAAGTKNHTDDQLRAGIGDLLTLLKNQNQLAAAHTSSATSNPQWVASEFTKLLAQKANATSKAGPELAGWTRDLSAPENTMAFTWTHDGQTERLEFVKLQVAGRGMYLCTTDVNVGLFAATVAADHKAADVANFLNKPVDMFSDSWRRTGPRGWRWDGDAIKPNGQWLYIDSQVTQPPYAWGNDISRAPGPDMPLQRISPAGALYFARLLGCRLPTSAEWTAAYQAFGGRVPADSWNLRDQTWQQQRDHVAALNGTIDWPDDGIFVPKGQTPPTRDSAPAWTRQALHAAYPDHVKDGSEPYQDGWGFFRPVHQASWPAFVPEDLVGNVAIYVLDDPEQAKALEKPGITLADARKIIVSAKDQLFVIGGSALSPPTVPVDQPEPLPPKVVGRTDVAAQGFSDVGMRLAFSEPIESIPDGIARITSQAEYLFAAR